MSATRVTAVIPHWNRYDLLESLFLSMASQSRPFDHVLVVDNGSSDGSPDLAQRYGAQVLALGSNLGFAAAVNRGIAACQSDWVAIVNNDVTLEPDWLLTLTNAAETHGAHFAAGKLLRADDPSVVDGTFDELSRGACACRCGAGKPDGPLWNQPRRIRFAPMTAALFRRDLFTDLGPLDESFGSYLEDIDFGVRCALASRTGIYVPAAVGYHRGSSTLGKWNSDTVRLLSHNQVLLAAKYFRGEPLWPLLAGQLLWGLVALRHHRGFSYFRGKLAGLRDIWALRSGDQLYLSHGESLRSIVEASEREIFDLEKQSGFTWYWRVYFWLQRR